MTYLIWTSLVSLVLGILMIAYRSYELSTGRQVISNLFRDKSDKKVLTFLGKNIILFNRFYRRVTSKLVKVPEFAGHRSHDIWQVLSKKIDLFFEKLKGKKTIDKRGSVSLYWQSVSQSKDNKIK